MKKTMLLLFILVGANYLSAQNVTTYNTSGPVNCDGKAVFNNNGQTVYTTWIWHTLPDSNIIQVGGDTLFSLCAGSYFLGALDSLNSMYVKNFTIAVDSLSNPCTNSSLYAIIPNTTNASADSICDGDASVYAGGGTQPYAYLWSNNSTSLYSTGLCAGYYTVIVTDANGCTAAQSVIITSPGDTTGNPCSGTNLTLATSTTDNTSLDSLCNGSATAIATGGTPPYSYSWNVGSLSSTVYDLCGGEYGVTVTDANGCSTNTSVIIKNANDSTSGPCDNVSISASISTSISTSACDGSATAYIFGGFAPYTYDWSNGYHTQTINNLCPGNYYLQVTDSNGCIGYQFGTVYGDTSTYSIPLSAYVSSTDASGLNNCDGAASVFVYGGTQPYTYLFSNGSTTATLSSLCPNYYSVFVTDANGNQDSLSFVIAHPEVTYVDSNSQYFDSTVVATLTNEAEELCSIDFTSIDSINIIDYTSLGLDSIIVEWALYINGVDSSIFQNYGIGGDGIYQIILQLFCDGVFKTNSVTGFIKAIDFVDVNNTVTGIKNKNVSGTIVYPNPFNSDFNIALSGKGNHTITMYDLSGRVVYSAANVIGKSLQNVSLNNLSNGYYFLKIESAEKVETIKVVKN